jgi:CxxC motif-containing protein (DUF1111 family)
MSKTFRVLSTVLAFLWAAGIYSAAVKATGYSPAPAGFDNLTNGFVDQPTFDAVKEVFEERDDIAKGLGPLYNAQSCAECHQTPITGGISQITELRAGRFFGGVFTDHPGGSLINDRAIGADIQESVYDSDNVRTLRTTLNTLGDGFVEAIADATFTAIRSAQPPGLRGQIINVPIVEAGAGVTGVGRFGWKGQHASLVSFSGDAYLNEQGVTNRLFLVENTSSGHSVAAYDTVPDIAPNGEDPDDDVSEFAEFMRATKAPSRGPMTAAVNAGEGVFTAIGCNICHTPMIATAAPGTIMHGGFFTVAAALGNKIIRPFSDFLLHDVGTGDGIVQNGGPTTRNKMRTPPLWGVRTRSRLMHDGKSLTFERAILRHGGQAEPVMHLFKALPESQKDKLFAFLASL